MRNARASVLLLVLGTACATSSASETALAPSFAGSARGLKLYTAIATPVAVSPDSAYQLLVRAYAMLELPMVSVEPKRAVGNDDLRVRRRVAGLPMQTVLDCGAKLDTPNAETWDIDMNLLSYVKADPGGGSQVLTGFRRWATRPKARACAQTPCATTGELEKKIADMVVQLAAGK